MSRLHALTAAVAATAAAAALAPSASAIPFGADLTRPANNFFGCEASGFIPNSPLAPPGQLFITPSGQTSWTWTSNGRLGDFAGTLSVPRSGRVTQVRIKAGPVTGPMQVVSVSTLNTFPVPTNRPQTGPRPAARSGDGRRCSPPRPIASPPSTSTFPWSRRRCRPRARTSSGPTGSGCPSWRPTCRCRPTTRATTTRSRARPSAASGTRRSLPVRSGCRRPASSASRC